jgi:putative transposase
VKAALSGVSERRSCRVLAVHRAGLHRPATTGRRRSAAYPPWIEPLRRLIQQHPTFGYRHLWALLRGQEGIIVNRNAVYRVLKQKRWLVHQRSCTPRPRVCGWVSRANRSDERWAMDVTHIPCGQDGWAHLAAVIDCYDREVIGMNLRCAVGRRRRNARSKRRVSTGSAHSGPSVRRSYATTTG